MLIIILLLLNLKTCLEVGMWNLIIMVFTNKWKVVLISYSEGNDYRSEITRAASVGDSFSVSWTGADSYMQIKNIHAISHFCYTSK